MRCVSPTPLPARATTRPTTPATATRWSTLLLVLAGTVLVLGMVFAMVAGSAAGPAEAATLVPTTTTITSTLNPSTVGQATTLKATVTAATGAPTGTVTFRDGATVLGTATWWFGTYSLSVSGLSAGSHAITATYGGNTTFQSSTGSLTQSVVAPAIAATTTALRTTLDPISSGQSATVTATVTVISTGAGAPASTVTFREGTKVLGTAAWWFGAYNLRLPELAPGDHVITAAYTGSAAVAGSSASLTQRVRVTTAVDAAVTPAPATTTETVTVTATVRPVVSGAAIPTGTITVSEGAAVLATTPVTQGRGVAALTGLAAGDHALTLRYSGDGVNLAGTGATTVVVRIASTLTVTASQSPSAIGQPVTFTASVLPHAAGGPVATGSIAVIGGISNHGSAPLVNGTASVTLSSLEAGDHLVTVTYDGDTLFRSAATSIAHVVGTATAASTESAPLVVTTQPTAFQRLSADVSSPASTHGGDGGNQIRLPSDGNLLWAQSDVAGFDTAGAPFMVNNVVSISSPSSPLVRRQPLSPTGVPFQLVKPTSMGPCTAPGSARVFWNAGMVAIPQAGWDQVLIWFQAYCLAPDMTLTPTSIGLAELHYTPAMASDMVHPWSDHVRILDEDLYGASNGMQLPELGPDGNIYLYRCYANGAQPAVEDMLGCKVARVAPLDAADASKYRYWNGTGWGATSEAGAAYMSIPDTATPARLPAGMFKVTYIPQANLWVLGSQAWPGFNGTPLFRVARSPQGPWSVGATIPYLGCDGHTCYGSMVSAALSDATHLGVVYFDNHGQDPATNSPDSTAAGQLHVVTAGITMPSASSGPSRPMVPTSTTVTTPVNPVTGGQVVTVTATVVPAPTAPDPSGATDTRTPAGTVTFREGATVLGTATRFFGTYSATLPVLGAGTHTITAAFSGDDAFDPSSATVTVTVQRAVTKLSVTSSANPSTLNQPATVSATLAVVAPGAGTPPGTVTFSEGSTVLGSATLFFGRYNLALPNLPAGDHVITAFFAGDATYGPSTVSITQKVQRIATTVAVTTSAASVKAGTAVTFAATVTGGPWTSPTGTVTFMEGSTVLGTGTSWFGSYNLTLKTLSAGSHTITAKYSGDASFAAGSATVIQIVTL